MTLPQSWAVSSIGALADKGQYGWTTKAAQTGEVRFLRTTDITRGLIDWSSVPFCAEVPADLAKYLLEPGDIVISRAGSVGFSRLMEKVPSHTVFASYLIRFKPSSAVVPRYLAAYLNSDAYWTGIGAASVGIALANVNAKSLAALPVPLAPLAEQKRIADKLDTVLTRVDATNTRLARVAPILKRFRQSVLAAATSGRLTVDMRIEYETTSLRLGDAECQVPKSWEASTLAQQIDPSRPLCYGVVQPGLEKSGGVPLIRVQDMERGSIAVAELRTVGKDVDQEFSRSRVVAGDVLVSVVGTIGRIAVVPPAFSGNIARAVARVAPARGIEGAWLRYWLESPDVQWWLTSSSKEVARKTLNLGDLAKLPVPVPPKEEQTEIIRRVETLFAFADRLEARLQAARTATERLTPALLAKAFRGELVPQDPNDEPASELLKRLASGSATSAPKRGRKKATGTAA